MKQIITILISVLVLADTNAQLISFPGAEGAGKYTSGGRGTPASAPTVYEVTNLGDVNAAGSLRYAATVSGPTARIIVFRVAGTIHLTQNLTLNRANTTIAGQTAPGDGICIADYPVYVNADNIIVRYLRFRLGDKNQAATAGNDDAFSDNGNGRKKIMIDHCTMSWSNDEAFTFYKGDSITLQWNMISEPLDYSYHNEGSGIQNHAYGGIWGGKRASFHHNLFAHCRGRMPRFDGIRNIPADTGDYRNNVIYNWADYNVNGGEGGAYNVVNNYYKYGLNTPSSSGSSTGGVNRRNMLINPSKQTSPVLPYGKFYLTGNYTDNSVDVTNANWKGAAFNAGSLNDSIIYKSNDPFNHIPISTQSATDAYASVLSKAGCSLPNRDTLDARIVSNVVNRTGTIINVQGGYPIGTPYSTSQTAWPTLAPGFAPTDTDHDGMPDIWESHRGLNSALPSDLNGYISTSGYSNIENYINGDTVVASGIYNTCVATKMINSANTGSWIFARDTTYSGYSSPLYQSSVDSNHIVAGISDNGAFGVFNVTFYTTNTIRYDVLAKPFLNRNITIAPVNPLLITSPVTIRFYFTTAEYNALKAVDPTINTPADLRVLKVPTNNCVNANPAGAQVIVPSSWGTFGTYQNGYYLEFTTASLSTFFIQSASAANYKVVAKDGSGDYLTVQSAIDAAPTGAAASNPVIIYIKNGRYHEKITIPSNKPFIQLTGESVANVILTFNDYAGKMLTCGTTVGTQNSASFTVNATDFAALNITFENSHPHGTPDNNGQQAVAILVNNDRAAFKNCRFLGNQDTKYLKGSGMPRHYFKNCYTDGLTDYIFGSSIALFDSCVLYNKNKTGITSSYIVAPNTTTGQSYGFVFRNARIGGNDGGTIYYLGRPWQNNPKAVFIGAYLMNYANIHPAGWSTNSAGAATIADSYFAEHKTRKSDGSLADVSQRTPGTFQLTDADTVGYNLLNIFSGWDPCAVRPDLCTNSVMPIAVSNFRGAKGTSSSQFDWNISWPMAGVEYNLFRSADNINFTSVYNTIALSDTAVNFKFIDAVIPASGSSYYYYVSASKAGFATHNTDTVRISSEPRLTVNASDALYLCGFSQALGSPSAAQTYTISGSDLTSNITITPPANYEVSLNNSAWFTNSSPLTVTHTGGTVSVTTIFVRLNAAAPGTYSGTILHSTTGAATKGVQVSGTTVSPPTSFLLQAWALTLNNNDSVPVRSPGVVASSSSLKNLFVSDGSAASANIPGYSVQYGQALGANAAGNNWSAVGGTLKRDYYEQFTVTAKAGYTVRVDSITFSTAFHLTTSGIKMAVVYSKNGFSSPADSSEFSNGTGPGGGLITSASGNFARSFPLTRQDTGPTDYYTLALNNATGVSLSPGQVLTIRLYWACSSTGTPRFAYLKNVAVKGVAIAGVLPLQLVSFNAVPQDNIVKLLWQTTNEFNTHSFIIERSVDGRMYNAIGSLPAGNRGSYQFNDIDPLAGVSYYRLKITDVDGSFSYSKTIAVNRTAGKIRINPNPVLDKITISHPSAYVGAWIKIMGADGRTMVTQIVQRGSSQSEFSLLALPKGVYSLVFNDGRTQETINFIKQ